jgi:hypothetical protein
MVIALFGIENDGLNLVVNLLVFFLFVIYVALVYWTYADASRRLEDPMLIACATVASMFPFIGTIVYTIVRPPEYLEDVHEREVETKAAELRLRVLENRTCANCGNEIEPSYLRCPNCMRRLKEPCGSCRRPLDPMWKVCPYCETEVPQPTRSRSERRRPRREQRTPASPSKALPGARDARPERPESKDGRPLDPTPSARRAKERRPLPDRSAAPGERARPRQV